MEWFQELINTRLVNDRELLTGAFADLSASILGEKGSYGILNRDKQGARDAIGEILDYYHAVPGRVPERSAALEEEGESESVNAELDYMLRPSGILRRPVHLTGRWYRDSSGPLLGEKDGKAVALLPRLLSGYRYRESGSGRRVRVNRAAAAHIGREAFCFYAPLPRRPLGRRDLIAFIIKSLTAADILSFVTAALVLSLLGMVMPAITNLLFTNVAVSGEIRLLLSAMGMMLGVALASFLIEICKNLFLKRIGSKTGVAAEAALMGRLLMLPPAFFKPYAAGETAERMGMAGGFCGLLSDTILAVAVDLLFSFIYFFQVFRYTPALLLPALCVLGTALVFFLFLVFRQSKITALRLKKSARTSGFIHELFNGIQKIRLAGGENRAFAQWAGKYRDVASLDFNPPLLIKSGKVIGAFILLLGNVLIYFFAGRAALSPADFITFSVTYGMMCAALMSLSAIGPSLASLGPMLDLISPILKAVPELSNDREYADRLSGSIELNNVSFRYSASMPLVIDNLSLKIRKGQYVAIVGKTGCGKSTLFRLLLGFEKPLLGSIYYDSKDLEKLDLKSVRKNIGAVMQNGRLLQGSIYENILIAAPHLGLEEAWAAAELAGLAEDIRSMPMGMFTMVGEGGGGFSGGQKQRLMVARAVASRPRILLMDEATSALDNITQKRVTDALDKLKVTRIVIAHRLSTIRSCDRIIVLEKGRIAEEGTYDELIARKGVFAELVSRQQLDEGEGKALA
ncbi:hypothetical protein AGMMS50268_15200 [Spirochaetia bacterium]|nr:hypothetical protein AGMMS50268_15200 [Spirochaetia bacterium]